MSHDGSTLADTTWRHPAVTRSDYRRPAPRDETARWAAACRPTSDQVVGAWLGYPESRPFAELFDSGEDLVLRAVRVGMLRESDC
jgi:hypothetical protein